MKRLSLILVLSASAALMAANAIDPAFQKVVEIGDPVPGLPGDVRFSGIAHEPAIGEGGHVVFLATFAGSGNE